MLGKLMKYEFKATYRIFLPFFAGVLVLAGFARLFLLITEQFDNVITVLLNGILTLLYSLVVIALLILPEVISFYRFYKNLVSDEGYLSFTLPVTPMQHIMCKFLTSIIWCLIGYGVAFLSFAILHAGDDTLPELFNGLYFEIVMLVHYGNASVWGIIIEIIFIAIASVLSSFAAYYLCIAIGQMLFKNKLLGSFAVFGIYYVTIQTLNLILVIPTVIISEALDPQVFEILIHVFLIAYALFYLALFLVGIFVTNHIFKKKLNLA